MFKLFNYIEISGLQDKDKNINARFYKALTSISKKEIRAKEVVLEFGKRIVKNGHFQDSEKLSNTHFSFGMVLENAFEIFVDNGYETMPIEVLKPGQIFPIDEMDGFEHILPKHLLNMTAGARSIFLSPKISDAVCFTRLAKKYGLELDIPKNLYDEWQILVNLAAKSNPSWRAKMLIISIEKESFFSDACESLRNLLIQSTIPHHKILKNWALFDINRSSFLKHEFHKADTNILEHIKQVCFIGNGMLPGFVFATNDLLGPIELFKQIFIEVYGIQYAPHIIHPGTFDKNQTSYYSIQLKGHQSHQRQRETSFSQLKELKRTLHHFQDFLSTSKDDLAWTIFRNRELSFFHHNPGNHPKIKSSSTLPAIDPVIAAVMEKSGLPFCDASPFLRSGCISIHPQTIH